MSGRRQSVNFFRRPPPRHRLAAPFSLAWSATAALLFAVLLGLASAYDAHGQHQQAQLLAAAAQATAAQAATLDALRQQYPQRQPDSHLAEEAERLARQAESWRSLLDRVEPGGQTQRTVFSPYFEALARRIQPNTWLTGIRLGEGGEDIELAGSTLAPDEVPALISALGQESAFANRRFAELEMQRADAPPERIDFVLRTTAKEAAGHGTP